jgi:hypothetical protein
MLLDTETKMVYGLGVGISTVFVILGHFLFKGDRAIPYGHDHQMLLDTIKDQRTWRTALKTCLMWLCIELTGFIRGLLLCGMYWVDWFSHVAMYWVDMSLCIELTCRYVLSWHAAMYWVEWSLCIELTCRYVLSWVVAMYWVDMLLCIELSGRYVLSWHVAMYWVDMSLCIELTCRYVLSWVVAMYWVDMSLCIELSGRYVLSWHVAMYWGDCSLCIELTGFTRRLYVCLLRGCTQSLSKK